MADTTLSILLPGVPLRVAGEWMEVRPVVLRELRQVERVFEGWAVLVASGGETLLPEAWDAFLELTAAAYGKDRAYLTRLAEADFEHLVSFVLAINKDLWDPPESADTDIFTWSQIVQRLVKAGHPWDSIQNLTLPQVKAFLVEGLRQEREELAQGITAASFSMADGKTVQQVTKELRRG